MSDSVDLDLNTHALCNTFPALLGDDDTLGRIDFMDVGTGNCNILYDTNGTPLIYFDFGGNGRRGAKTYPYKARPNKNTDRRPSPAFPTNGNAVKLVMSHWDEDHVYSLKAQPDMKDCAWLGPREDLAPSTSKLLAASAANLRVWQNTDSRELTYQSKKDVTIKLVRCAGLNGNTTDRNETGIIMVIDAQTPTRAEAAAQAIEKHAKDNPEDADGALQKGIAVAGHDVFRECVIEAATLAATAHPKKADVVATAARAAVTGKPVKAATLAILAAMDAAKAGKTVAELALAATRAVCEVLDTFGDPAAKVLTAMEAAVGKGALDVVTDGASRLAGADAITIKAVLTALDASQQQNATAATVLQAAHDSAGLQTGLSGVKEVLDALKLADTNKVDAPTAVSAGIAAAKGGVGLAATIGALTAFRARSDAATTMLAALNAAVAHMKPRHSMFSRAITAAEVEGKKGSSVAAVANAMMDTLNTEHDSVRDADAAAVIVAMKKRLLQASPSNSELKKAAGDPKEREYYAHRVIKAAHDEIEKLKSTDDPTAVFKAALAVLDKVPEKFLTRVLLTGDACWGAVPSSVLKDKEWDVLLAYHHGSINHFKTAPPKPVLKGISTVVYCAGFDGVEYVYSHPEAGAVTKYQQGGWTVELHTHPWKSKARGNRTYKLPYTT